MAELRLFRPRILKILTLKAKNSIKIAARAMTPPSPLPAQITFESLNPEVPPTSMTKGNMAASADNNLDFSASLTGILNEKHSPEHLQVLKAFTAALREEEYRYGRCYITLFFRR